MKVYVRQKGPSTSKVLSQLLTVINLKQYTGFIIKSFSIVPYFCLPLLISYGSSLVFSRRSSNPLLNSFPLEKLIDLIAKLHVTKTKTGFLIFEWIK